MEYKIIVDSCCDLTPQLREKMGIVSVPLKMRLGQKEFVDDQSLDLDQFMREMKACKEKVGSSAPSFFSFQEAIQNAKNAFVVTLSSQLSGSYASAVMGKESAEEDGVSSAYVFDSKSASAAETLVAVKLHELISLSTPKEQIIKTVEQFIDNMKTYFVLENYENLQKNGRLNKITGKLIQILNVKLIMGTDRMGNIALYEKARGAKQMMKQLLLLIEKSGKTTVGEKLVISHCNNLDLATRLSEAIKQQFQFQEILIIPSGGLSSLYTDDKGIVLAF